MRKIGSFALAACVSATLAAVPVGIDLKDPSTLSASSAFAKDGNGGGNGNGGGGGNGNGGGSNGGGNGKGGGNGGGHGGGKSGDRDKGGSKGATGHGKSESAHAKADTRQKKDPIANAFGKLFGKGDEAKQKPRSTAEQKSKPARKTKTEIETAKLKPASKEPTLSAKLGGLNSLNRNYHAYMNSNSPRMAAVRAYVTAYAAFELENGVGAVPTDPALSDEALSAALLAAANKNINTAQPGEEAVVDPEVMAWAKDVLGVGPAVGKIDQVRDELAARQPTDVVVEQPTEPETEQPTDVVVEQPTEPETEQPTDVVEQPTEPEIEQTAAVE
ncbi:MAG TPA: hypothetical protein VM468_07105 [Mycoplana sp.]|nr:hypothetical protein [Mycoplana sp.]